MSAAKIVFIGAGSMSFGVSMFRDMFSNQELSGSKLVLVDINRENLDRMYQLAVKMNESSAAGITVEKTVDRLEALPGASFVINSVAIDRNRLWKHDFEIPRKYGIRHTLGENGGPGGLFFTLRTVPLVMDIARDMERLCPEAYFINYSNPESRLILALGMYTKIRSIGLCHGIFMTRNDIAKIMSLPAEQLDVYGAGMNHFQWLLQIKDRETDKDLYPLLREKEANFDGSFRPLTRKLFHAFSYWPTCSDDHMGEYLPYGWEGGEVGYDFDGDERYRARLNKQIEAINAGSEPIPEVWFQPSGERGIKLISAIIHGKRTQIESGIVHNCGAIQNLPDDCAVEVPIAVDGGGIHPHSVGDLPGFTAALLLPQAEVQRLSVEAAVRGSKEIALQALLVDPVVNTITGAEKLLDELWGINEPYIRDSLQKWE